MAQDITLLGASYQAVPAVTLPKTGGGTASFTDVTDTTAAAADVATGKYFYTAAGVRTEGTSSGGGGTDYLEARLNGTLTSYENDNVVTLAAQSFRDCTTLTSLKVHNVLSIGNAAIYGCNGLTALAFPKLGGSTTPGAMQNNTNLEALDLGPDGAWAMPTVSGNSKLTALVLRRTSGIVPLNGINALNNTPFASGNAGGILYVPNALISTYQGATNWSTILGYANNQIKSIESTHTDPTAPIDLTLYYADGTPIT